MDYEYKKYRNYFHIDDITRFDCPSCKNETLKESGELFSMGYYCQYCGRKGYISWIQKVLMIDVRR